MCHALWRNVQKKNELERLSKEPSSSELDMVENHVVNLYKDFKLLDIFKF